MAIVSFIILYLIVIGFHKFLDPIWKVPFFGVNMLLDSVVLSWFVSGYKRLDDGYKSASSDLFNSISDLSIQTDNSLIIKGHNIKAEEALSVPTGSLTSFLASHGRYMTHEMSEIIDKLISDPLHIQELVLKDSLGAEKTYQIKVSEFNWRGRKSGYNFLLSDLTPLKEKEIELAELNNTKDQIFSIIAHDLRKPALAFKGITNKVNYLIQKKDFDLLSSLGNSIEKSATQLNTLLDNLLKWALSQKGMIEIKKQPVNVKALTDELLKTFELITQDKGITINNSEVDPQLIFNTDPDILNTILRNLVDNAIKYSKADSTIMLNIQSENDSVKIKVKDFGIGMSQEQLDNLFGRDRTKSTLGTHGEQGSGLGLNLVNDLVQKIGGVLTCDSSPSVGTEMCMNFIN